MNKRRAIWLWIRVTLGILVCCIAVAIVFIPIWIAASRQLP